ncbi:MAG: hypothetical protein J5874_01250 [Oscillospiraceae bacterium]|nr:hypothetical protein [Oscillospiraceae bacterium]
MKKSIIVFAVVMIMAMTAALFSPVFAGGSDPVIFDLTVENPVVAGKEGKLCMTWSGEERGTSGYDADEKAWKLENTKTIPGWQGGYEEFKYPEDMTPDFEVYQYCVITYKTVGMHGLIEGEGENKIGLNGDGAVTIHDGLEPSDEYTNAVISTEDFEGTTKIIIVMNAHSGGNLEPGCQILIKYIAFFATKTEAEAFDGTKDVPLPAPETENGGESGKTNADTSDAAMISGAIVLCAAAAVVVAVSKICTNQSKML